VVLHNVEGSPLPVARTALLAVGREVKASLTARLPGSLERSSRSRGLGALVGANGIGRPPDRYPTKQKGPTGSTTMLVVGFPHPRHAGDSRMVARPGWRQRLIIDVPHHLPTQMPGR